jgi:hypothetical protein
VLGGGEQGRPGFGQGSAVDFACGSERQLCERHEERGHHVFGQPFLEEGLQLPRRDGVPHHVGHQPLVVAVSAGRHHRTADAGMAQERLFHFARLDTEAAYLDLGVHPAQEGQRPVGLPARQIARAIEPATCSAEGIGHETLGGQLRPVPVAAGQAPSARVQLAWHAHGHRVQGVVEHVHPRVVDRTSDGHAGRLSRQRAHPVTGGEGRVLGGAVAVDQPSVRRQAVQIAPHRSGLQHVPSGQHLAHLAQILGRSSTIRWKSGAVSHRTLTSCSRRTRPRV